MHTHVVQVLQEPWDDNDKEDVETVRELFEKALKKKITKPGQDAAEMRSFMRQELPNLIEKRHILWCDQFGKNLTSYFLNIFVGGKTEHIIMAGIFWPMDSLRDIATYNVAKQMEVNTDVEKLEIPEALKADIELICRQLNKTKV